DSVGAGATANPDSVARGATGSFCRPALHALVSTATTATVLENRCRMFPRSFGRLPFHRFGGSGRVPGQPAEPGTATAEFLAQRPWQCRGGRLTAAQKGGAGRRPPCDHLGR